LIVGQALAEAKLPEVFLKRLFKMSIGTMMLIQFLAFSQNLRRYSVGRTGTWKFFEQASWHPPMMSNLVALELAMLAIALSMFGMLLVLRTESSLDASL
jgi:hypothetical protein